jgi:hypothetical protein
MFMILSANCCAVRLVGKTGNVPVAAKRLVARSSSRPRYARRLIGASIRNLAGQIYPRAPASNPRSRTLLIE